MFFQYSLFDLVWCKTILYSITHRNESVPCLYLIWLNMLIIHDVTLTLVIFSETSSFYELKLTRLYVLSCTNLYFECPYYYMFLYGFSSCTCLYEWLSIFLWVFVVYMFVRMTIHINLMGFRHVHVCTNDYPFPCEWVFVMHIPVRMTIYFFWMGFRHVHDENP